jgi:hypothetical protein
MYIQREIKARFLEKLVAGKVLILLGARRVGKTSFIKELVKENITEPLLSLNGEDMSVSEIFKNRTIENFKRLIGNNKILIVDEAQKIDGIGQALKLMTDEFPDLKIIVTGSSVFDLGNKLGEPLTGRKNSFYLFPLSQSEFSTKENLIETKSNLEERLIFGSYPEILSYASAKDKTDYLNELVSSYLLKDILEFDGIKNSSKLIYILRLLSFQIGKEVSLEEIGKQTGLSRNTVERYLDLLQKVFVVYKLPGFSRNLRNEVTKTGRYFFYDNGIRNSIIANFNTLTLRNDIGELWENYIISERLKWQNYSGIISNNYFWRTYQQQEIDFIEDRQGKLFAYEIKWNPGRVTKIPKVWMEAYPNSEFKIINSENYLDWICPRIN